MYSMLTDEWVNEKITVLYYQVQEYADAIQWMDPHLFFNLFTPVIIFNVAFDMDVYLFHKLFWQVRSYFRE